MNLIDGVIEFEVFSYGSTNPAQMNISTLSEFKHKICDIPANNIIFAAHHKSGTNLLREIKEIITDYYRQKCVFNRYNELSIFSLIRNDRDRATPIIAPTYEPRKFKPIQPTPYLNEIIIILHIIRHPVYMILSGYNYHKLISNEIPTHRSTIDNLKNGIGYISSNKNYFHCYSKLFYKNDQNNVLYDTYIVQHKDDKDYLNMFYHKFTIQYILQNIFNTTYGIIWEYERFVCLEGPEMLNGYLFVHDLNLNDNNIFAENFSLKQFETDFNGTCNKLLDILGIDGADDRLMLMQKLMKSDQKSTKFDSSKEFARNHATKALYNKSAQIDLLLHDNHRCLYLKNMTNMLHINWTFDKYC